MYVFREKAFFVIIISVQIINNHKYKISSTAMLKAVIHTLWLNKTLTEAITMLKLHHQLSGKLQYDEGFEKVGILKTLSPFS